MSGYSSGLKMLYTLGLLLLLTPSPSFQTTTNPKRDARGSNVTKTNSVLTLLKPKTTSKQIVHPTLKPNTVNMTVSPTSGPNQKPTTASPTKTTKPRLSIAVNQTTPTTTPKATTTIPIVVNKDKHKVNQTASKDNPASTAAPKVQSTSTKAPSTSKTTKIKPQSSANPSTGTLPKSSSAIGGSAIKDKSDQNAQPTSVKTVSIINSKTVKNKTTASVNQTVDADHRPSKDETSKDKPALTNLHNVPSTPTKHDKAGGSTAEKNKTTASANHTSSLGTTVKEKLAPSQPIKVVISDSCESSNAKEQELTLKPGAPLLMTHKISLLPGACTGECEAEMADLKGRVAILEKAVSFLLEQCPCSANCPNDCSGNGKCEKGKCSCHQGFMGLDCSKCAQGAKCSKEGNKNAKVAEKNVATQTKKIIPKEEDKGQKEGSEDKATGTKVASNAKERQVKLQENEKTSDKKFIGNISPRNDGSKQEARKGKTETKDVSPTNNPKPEKKQSDSKPYFHLDNLKDDPQSNATQSNKRKTNGTTKIETSNSQTTGPKKNKKENDITGKSTLEEKDSTQSSEKKLTSTDKTENKNEQSTENRKTTGGVETEKTVQKSQHVKNTTKTTEKINVLTNKTDIQSTSAKTTGGLGSLKVVNVSSHNFTVTWLAPQGMFKNFTVVRKETLTESEHKEQLEVEAAAWNSTEVQSENTNLTISSSKTAGLKDKTETKRISVVVPGNVRSVEFTNLRADTRYALQIFGATADRRSKIHRITAITGPEPPTELVFSNVTEYSLAVSWTKPKTVFTGFRVTYINKATGKSRFVTVSSKQSHFILSELSAGSSYIISVATIKGRAQSVELASVITTVPAPPIHLQVNNVTDTRAVLQWMPSLGKVDSFIVNYESSKTPNVTVTVMLSGNSVQYQLKGLQRGTLYKVKVLSQKDSLKSMVISTTFTTANVVRASEVGARSAVITWRTPVVYHSYRVIYQVAGEEAKEVILEPTFTEYKLTGLLPLSRYTVLVQGGKNEHYTSLVTSQFITGKLRFPFPTECSQELLNGALESGEVDIYPQGREGQAVRVYCDMETDGGGWTVFQRRTNGKTDFYRSWSDYKAGFGNLSEEFWLGNELLHNLTSMGPVSLRVDMRSGNDTVYAHYTNFSVASEEKNYILTVSGYTGTAGDSMKYHNGRPFSTRDKEPDSLGIHCAKAYIGGWWYKNCYKVNLNGLYDTSSNNQGIVWIDWKGKDFSIPFTEMKFRPSRFSPATHG